MTDKKYKYWLAVVDGQLVRFSDLAHMMATALHPEGGMDYAAARSNLDDELKLAVRDGLLRVRNPAGLGFHTFPYGDALQRAVMMPNVDLEPFLNARGIELRITPHGNGPEYWTLENAAAAMREQEDWHDGTRAEFQDQLQDAAQGGALVVLEPRTCLPYQPETVRTYWEYVTPSNVNTWLRSIGAPYEWTLQPTQPQDAPEQEAATPAPMEKVIFSAPPSLYSISANGLRMIDDDGYEQYLADKAERNAKGRYTIAEAAQVLADAHGLNPANFLKHRMMPAFDSDKLRVIDPTDGGPVRGRKCNPYSDEVTPSGVDAWLVAEGFADHVRWPVVSPMPPKAMPTAAEPIEVKPKAPATGPKLSTNKAALISQHEHEWPTIRRDLQDASTNGLSEAAKAGVRDWNEDAAMQWARSKNKLNQAKPANTLAAVMSSLPSTKHRIQG